MKQQQTNKHHLILIGLIILLLAAVAISFLLGRYPMTLNEFFTTLFSPFTGVEVDSFLENTIFQVRFPRILVAILIGSGSVSYTQRRNSSQYRQYFAYLCGNWLSTTFDSAFWL